MSNHVTQEGLDRLRAGTLPPAEMSAMGRHAAVCPDCRDAVVAATSLEVRALRMELESVEEHLSEDALMELADSGRFDAHADECAICRGEVEELRALKRQIAPRPRWPLYAIAASVALLLLLLPSMVRRNEPSPWMGSAPRVATPPVTTPAGYGRADWDGWVAAVKATRRLAVPPVVEELRGKTTSFRGGEEEDDLVLQPNHVVIAETRPRLQWKRRDGATYNVILAAGDRVVESGTLTAPEWRPPADLERGREYRWQVEVTEGGKRTLHPRAPEPPARFRVVEQSAIDAIDEARRRHPDDALLHVVLLARHGLRAEALAAVDRLAASDRELAEALRASLRAWPQ